MPKAHAWTDEYTLLCERCGYVIEGLDRSGACPECGKPIEESLPERRVGTAWQREPSWTSALQTWRRSLVSPRATLARMSFGSQALSSFRRFAILCSSLAMGLAACLYSVVIDFLSTSRPSVPRADDLRNIGVMAGAILCTYIGLNLLTLIEQRGLVVFSRHHRTRVTPGIARTVCDHGCVGWVFASAGALIGSPIALAGAALGESHSIYGDDPRAVLGLILLMGGLVISGTSVLAGLLFFEVFAWLGLRRCKFANRVRPGIEAPADGRDGAASG